MNRPLLGGSSVLPRPLQSEPILFPGFGNGCGAAHHIPGFYAICLNGDTRFGFFMPGPREEADETGIAAGFRVYQRLKATHDNVNWIATYNGTDSKIYREEAGAWVLKQTKLTNQATVLISLKGAVAVGYGNATAYDFTTNDGTSWTASTKTANAKYMNKATRQMNGLLAPRVTYGVNPNLIFFTEDLTNGDPTGSTSSTIGDNNATGNFFTSLTEDETGLLLIGMSRALWTLNDDGTVQRLTPRDYIIPTADAGGQSDRNNFESFAILDARHYYVVEGYGLVEVYQGRVTNEFMAPKEISQQLSGQPIPRMDLPINAIVNAGPWLIVALGSKNTATLKGVAHSPGGTDLLGNSFSTVSELYAMRYQEDEQGHLRWTCHGILLQTSSPLRYMWYDDATNMLYLASGDSELINAQQKRCFLTLANPLNQLTGSIIKLATGAATLETGIFDGGDRSMRQGLDRLWAATKGLASTVPSMEMLYRRESDYINASPDYTSLVTWTADQAAEQGQKFPLSKAFYTARLQFKETGDATNNLYGVLFGASLEVRGFPYTTRWMQ